MRVDLNCFRNSQSFGVYYNSFPVTIRTITLKEYIFVKSTEKLFSQYGQYLGPWRCFARFGAKSCSFLTGLFTSDNTVLELAEKSADYSNFAFC